MHTPLSRPLLQYGLGARSSSQRRILLPLLVFVAVGVAANGFAYDIGEEVLYAGSFYLKGHGFLSLGKTAPLLTALDKLVSRSNLPEVDVRLGFN